MVLIRLKGGVRREHVLTFERLDLVAPGASLAALLGQYPAMPGRGVPPSEA